MVIVRVIFFIFNNFNFFCQILWIWVVVEVAISTFSEPVIPCFKLIRIVGIIIFFWFFVYIFICISAFASKREISTRMFICGFYILIISSVSGELGRIGGEVRAGPTAVEEILGMRSFNFISIISFESFPVDRVHI